VLFTDNIKKKVDVDALRTNIESVLGKDIRISYFTNLKDTGEVRSAYLLNYDSWRDASKIMPDKEFFVRGDIEFASECRRIVEGGVESIAEYLSLFDVIEDKKGNDDYIDTLCTFLLDANSNVQATSEKMFVHKNTIKYRIKTMNDCLGFAIGSMPGSEKLFKACGIKRLLD
jgi:DNA-binding PucR family transcriptional regulator